MICSVIVRCELYCKINDREAPRTLFRGDETWVFHSELLPGTNSGNLWSNFGKSVAIDGVYIVVGSPTLLRDASEAHVFKYNGTSSTWTFHKLLKYSDGMDDG